MVPSSLSPAVNNFELTINKKHLRTSDVSGNSLQISSCSLTLSSLAHCGFKPTRTREQSQLTTQLSSKQIHHTINSVYHAVLRHVDT